MGQYSVKDDLSLEDFRLMEEMEALYYSREYITPAETAYQWHLHNPYTGVVATTGETIAGFIDILPVGHSTYMKIAAGGLNDRDLAMEDVLTTQQMLSRDQQPVFLFVSCAVIHPDYRGKGVMAFLLKEYEKKLKSMVSWDVEFKGVLGDCVTPEGERFSQKLGMRFQMESDHGTKIFIGSFPVFLEKIQGWALKVP